MTPQEVKLWNWLREDIRPIGFHPRRQVPIDGYVADFAFRRQRLVIEVDGAQHGIPAHADRDRKREAALAKAGYRVLRFWNGEIDGHKAMVLETILAALGGPPPGASRHPPPSGEESRSMDAGSSVPYGEWP